VLLCRHMSRDDERVLHAAQTPNRGLLGRLLKPTAPADEPEPEELAAVAETLREALAHENLHVTAIRHGPSAIATSHAVWLRRKLALDAPPGLSMTVDQALDPSCFMKWRRTDEVDQVIQGLVKLVDDTSAGSDGLDQAVLVVGHMPQLGWLAERLLSNRPLWNRVVDGYVTPLALKNGEVACIALCGSRRGRAAGHLEWTVAPDEAHAIEELRDKIKSKMDTAKLLGGFMTLVLGGVLLAPSRLDELSRGGDRWAVDVAAGAFFVAIGLYLRTMYAYDSLLMPRRYWGEQAPGRATPRWLVRRPPSSAAWVLYQNMLHVWTFLFTPATVAVVLGLLALAYAALEPGWLEGVVGALVLIAFTFYGLWRRPVLGSQD
jgi:hypothetical protein